MNTEVNEPGTKSAQPLTRGILGTLQLSQAMPPIAPQAIKLQPVTLRSAIVAIVGIAFTIAIVVGVSNFLNFSPPAHTQTLSERVAAVESQQDQDAADHEERIQNLEQQVQDAQDTADEAQDAADKNARTAEENRFRAEEAADDAADRR